MGTCSSDLQEDQDEILVEHVKPVYKSSRYLLSTFRYVLNVIPRPTDDITHNKLLDFDTQVDKEHNKDYTRNAVNIMVQIDLIRDIIVDLRWHSRTCADEDLYTMNEDLDELLYAIDVITSRRLSRVEPVLISHYKLDNYIYSERRWTPEALTIAKTWISEANDMIDDMRSRLSNYIPRSHPTFVQLQRSYSAANKFQLDKDLAPSVYYNTLLDFDTPEDKGHNLYHTSRADNVISEMESIAAGVRACISKKPVCTDWVAQFRIDRLQTSLRAIDKIVSRQPTDSLPEYVSYYELCNSIQSEGGWTPKAIQMANIWIVAAKDLLAHMALRLGELALETAGVTPQ